MKGFLPESLEQKHGCALYTAKCSSLCSMIPFVSVRGE